MRLRHECGVWELFIPRLGAGALYKYELVGPDGGLLPLKADPVAASAEPPPATASVVADPAAALARRELARRAGRRRMRRDAPMSVYEVHAASWLPGRRRTAPSWQALADRLVPYVRDWGSPMSSSCRSWSIRSAAPGATSRSACSRPARGSGRRWSSRASSMPSMKPASA